MDAVALTVLVHGLGMIGLIFGGIAALYLGYRVMNIESASQQTATFKIGQFTATAKGTGAVIMITAAAWAYCGVLIAPKLTTGHDGSKVYTFQTSEGKVTAPEFAIATSNPGILVDSAKLAELFNDAVIAKQAIAPKGSSVSIRGLTAALDPKSTVVTKLPDGGPLLSTAISSQGKVTKLTFEPEARGSVVVFVPREVSVDNYRYEANASHTDITP